MDFDGSVNTAPTEGEVSEDEKKKNSVLIAVSLALIGAKGVTDTKEKMAEMYSLFTEMLEATGYTVVKKEI